MDDTKKDLEQNDELSETETAEVSGGLNPQPLPPHDGGGEHNIFKTPNP